MAQEAAVIYTQAMIDKPLAITQDEHPRTTLASNVIRLDPESVEALKDGYSKNVTFITISKWLLKAPDKETLDAETVDLVRVRILGVTRMLYNDLAKEQTLVEFPNSVMSILVTSAEKEDLDYAKIQAHVEKSLKRENELVLANTQTVRGIVRFKSYGIDAKDPDRENAAMTGFYSMQLRATGKASVTDANAGILYQIPGNAMQQVGPDPVWGALMILDTVPDPNKTPSLGVTTSIEFSVEFLGKLE